MIDRDISRTEHTFLSAHQKKGRNNTYKQILYDCLNTQGLFCDIVISVNDKFVIQRMQSEDIVDAVIIYNFRLQYWIK